MKQSSGESSREDAKACLRPTHSLSSPGQCAIAHWDRAIQYSRNGDGIRRGHGVLDSLPSRGMTAAGAEASVFPSTIWLTIRTP